MKAVFLSHPLSKETPLYMGEGKVSIIRDKILGKNSCNNLRISMPNHASTHVDVPYHFLENGLTLTDFPPEKWAFKKVDVIYVKTYETVITPEMIEIRGDAELLLLRTGLEKKRGTPDYLKNYPGVHQDVADFLTKRMPSIRALGTDLISISSPLHMDLGRKAHREFLRRNIILIEDMKLSQLNFKPSLVAVLPLMIKNGDGAPCSVLALE